MTTLKPIPNLSLIHLDDWSEPDLEIVRDTVLDYGDRHPAPGDIELLVELADSTLKRDCEIKDKVYAQAGIADYWVLDLKNRQLHVYCNPTPTGYTSHLILTEPNETVPLPIVSQSDALFNRDFATCCVSLFFCKNRDYLY
jgi:Uma2 family endonuclease